MKFHRMLAAGVLIALSTAATAQVFYTVAPGANELYTIDVSNGQLTDIGPLNANFDFGDLAFDTSTQTMYMTDGWGNGIGNSSSLYKVDLTTGNATFIGSMQFNNVFALVYDPITNKLFGACSTIGPLDFVEVNRSTGVATSIGAPGVGIDGLTYVGSTGDLVGCYAGPGSLHSIDRTTGAGTLVSPGGGFVNNCGIAWSSSNNTIYSIDYSGDVYAFDVANAYARTSLWNLGSSFDGLAAAGGTLPPIAYCTAGTTTNGCVPSIGATGAASATATSGFTITVSNVEGQKQGIIFYGISNTGFTGSPWGTGGTSFLCVKAPLQRTGVQSSGGTIGGCNGSLSLDWNAYRSTHPIALGNPFSAGQIVFAQGWFRDPPAVKTTNLSDAIKFGVGP